MIEGIETLCFRIGASVQKCLVLSSNTEPWTHLVWMDELHVAVELNRMLLNFIVLDMEVCDKLSIKKNQI
jgi:hypothetical protein